jgi:glutaminyl-tRNA synthetase
MSDEKTQANFIRTIIDEHLASGRFDRVHTRFPPEPNGYLHVGHAKAINISYGLAKDYGGKFNLRFDDTNPVKEEQEYIDAIIEDIRWLGADWEDRLLFASDYFEQLYQWAEQLIKAGKAYVDDLSADEIRDYRGTLTDPGRNSPYRDRSVEENLDLLRRMRRGEFEPGDKVLRAKIDMASPIINLRDPVMYRILKEHHPRTGNEWCIYPTYDWAHGQSDSIEGITHSLCTLEFENHRPLYDWFLDQLGIYHPQQIEFARGNLTYTITSKSKLRKLVTEGLVNGWDDPRLPTLRGLRRRGFTAEGIRNFWEAMGVSKANATIDWEVLENAIREDLNQRVPRVMAVLDPLRVVIENYPEDKEEEFEVLNYPQDRSRTESRTVPFSRVLIIEREDFMEEPVQGFFRLAPGREVRLMNAYYVTCTDVVKNEAGEIVELRCTYDPESRGGQTADKRKVRGTIHWVSAAHALAAEVRLYDRLFTKPDPEEDEDFLVNLNPDSLRVVQGYMEPSLGTAAPGDRFQFVRDGYFTMDLDSRPGALVFNRTAALRNGWARTQGS